LGPEDLAGEGACGKNPFPCGENFQIDEKLVEGQRRPTSVMAGTIKFRGTRLRRRSGRKRLALISDSLR